MTNKVPYLDLQQELLEKIKKLGSWVNAHAHIDRAYSLTKENYQFTSATLQEKWNLNDELKITSSVDTIYDRMALAIERMLEQEVTVLGTFIDVDSKIQDKAIKAAQKIRDTYK